MSKWDSPGVTKYIEDYWETSTDELSFRQAIAEWIGPLKGKVLDVGCGSARMAPLLQGGRYYGIDGSEEMLRYARQRAQKSSLKCHDFLLHGLPYEDGEFPTSICIEVLRHLPNYLPVLKEIIRVTSKQIFLVDSFRHDTQHSYGFCVVAGQTFADNGWSLEILMHDIEELLPEWSISVQEFPYAMGVKIEAV